MRYTTKLIIWNRGNVVQEKRQAKPACAEVFEELELEVCE